MWAIETMLEMNANPYQICLVVQAHLNLLMI